MLRFPVPDESNSLALGSDPNLRYFIAVKSKMLPIFQKTRAGDKVVKAFIPSAPGVEFEVGVYNGRKKMLKMNMLIEMWYGETCVVQWIVERKEFEPEAAADDQRRFSSACGVNIGEHHSRNFQFADIPKTDAAGAVKLDMEYLDKVSAITIKAYWIKECKPVAEKRPSPTKPSLKRHLGSDSQKRTSVQSKSSIGRTKQSQQPVDDLLNDVALRHEKRLRPIDETSDKGIFGLAPGFGELISTLIEKPTRREDVTADDDSDSAQSASDESDSESDESYAPRYSTKGTSGTSGASAKPSAAVKKPEKPKEWDYATKTLHTTAIFYLRSLPWISDFLYEFFFEPTPVLPPPEPTVQIGNTLYVDTTEQEAEDDAAAEGPAKKRMKETPSGPEKAPSQVPVANNNAKKQERTLEREAPTDDRNPVGATNDARASLASSNAAQPAHASPPTEPAQSAMANAAAPIVAAAKETALTVCEPASAVPATSVSARVATPAEPAGSASGAIAPSADGVSHLFPRGSEADAQAASAYAVDSATSVFRKMVKQDPEFARLAEQSTLSLSSIIPESLLGNRSRGSSPKRDLSPTSAPNPPDDEHNTTLASSSSTGISSLYTSS